MNKLVLSTGLLALALAPRASLAAVKPNPLFSAGMVLQRDMAVPVWGTAADGEKVIVEFAGQKVSTTADGGQWQVRLKKLKASIAPETLTITGTNTVTVPNVLVGEVWVCSGQSNMQWPLSASSNPQQEIAAASYPQIRLLTVPRVPTDAPVSEVKAEWQECSPQTVGPFSAVGYYFGRALHKSLGVPVGLISSNYGGTPAEAWTSRRVLESTPELHPILERYDAVLAKWPETYGKYKTSLATWEIEAAKARALGQIVPPRPSAPYGPTSPQRPMGLYNGMIAPLIPYAIRGAIWYQGESNAGQAWEYRTLFPAMIKNWREDWGQGDFPFLFVQLAPFMKKAMEPGESNWAELREAQLYTTKVSPKTGMAVITDVGEENDIHPKQKAPVGERLALLAREIAYREDVAARGPEYAGMKRQGDRIVLRFKHSDGLKAEGGALNGFVIAGEDRKWVNANAEIQGETVVVSAPGVSRPTAVRYGWANFPLGNLWNGAGLPASPFRTDDWPVTTQPKPSPLKP